MSWHFCIAPTSALPASLQRNVLGGQESGQRPGNPLTINTLCAVDLGEWAEGEIRLEELGVQTPRRLRSRVMTSGLSTHNFLSVPNLKELFYHSLRTNHRS